MKYKRILPILLTGLLMVLTGCAGESNIEEPSAGQSSVVELPNEGPWSLKNYQGKPSSSHTLERQLEASAQLPVGDFPDGVMISELAREQLIAELPASLGGVEFSKVAPAEGDTVHPSLSHYAANHSAGRGLFRIAPKIFQLRGGLAYITFVRGEVGWIVIDTGMTREFTADAWSFSQQHLPGGRSVPISTIIYSHSHVDHFGGVKGLVSSEDAATGKVEIIAPFGFMSHALAENVIAGSAMFRRANYHFGALLDSRSDATEYFSFVPSETGSVTLIPPTVELPAGQGLVTQREVDGVAMEFMDVGGAEAPSATLIYLPEERMIFNSELMFQGLHNIYTLRGAQTRDALLWSKLINQVKLNWGQEVECMTGPHGPNFCGNSRVNEFLTIQRDTYGFIHSQSVRLMNSGHKLQDIGQSVSELVPDSLREIWHTRGYHGTYSHNARGVTNRYLGFYDGNPASLNPLMISEEARRYVRYMGGADAILELAHKDFEDGEYRFVATVLNKLVITEPDNWPARHLLADALEQLGYQSEGPQWRNAYLSGAKELRLGEVLSPQQQNRVVDLLSAASVEELLDAMAVRVNVSKAAGRELRVLLNLTDVQSKWLLELSNGNLSSIKVSEAPKVDATLTLSKTDLTRLISGQLGLKDLVNLEWVTVDGSYLALAKLILSLDSDDRNHPLVGS